MATFQDVSAEPHNQSFRSLRKLVSVTGWSTCVSERAVRSSITPRYLSGQTTEKITGKSILESADQATGLVEHR